MRNTATSLALPVALALVGGLSILSGGCNSGRTSPPDGFVAFDLASTSNDDGGGGGGNDDGGGGGRPDMASGTGLPCTAGTYRCNGLGVEICNSSGTAWLYTSTCSVSCSAGLCTGACTPAAKRCNSNKVETCNAGGTAWTVTETCPAFCDAPTTTCALVSLDVTGNKDLDGVVVVAGDIIIRTGATLNSPSGDLTLRAKNILVENLASITAAPKGQNPSGQGGSGYSSYSAGGGGGGYGSTGGYGYGGGGPAFGSDTDAVVQPGGRGGDGYTGYNAFGGMGGGALRLIADGNITVSGQITANGAPGSNSTYSYYGGGGGGSGGGILLAATGDITVNMGASISAKGAQGGTSSSGSYTSGAGGSGRVKLLSGGARTVNGVVSGQRTDGVLPPMTITSNTHPNPDLFYNDGAPNVVLTWVRPFVSRQGYYQLINQSQYLVPTPANAAFINMMESVTYPADAVRQANNYFHITPVDSMSRVGTVENSFLIKVNTVPPAIASSSHPSSSTWNPKRDVFYSWTYMLNSSALSPASPSDPPPAQAQRNFKGVYYVHDIYGDTVPTTSSTFIPSTQGSQLISGLAPGIWVMHMLPVDAQGYLTKTVATYKVQIGEDPGTGVVLGQVVDGTGNAVDGVTITVNRGLYTQSSNNLGNYNFPQVPAGSWELRASKSGKSATQMITVSKGMPTTANFTLK